MKKKTFMAVVILSALVQKFSGSFMQEFQSIFCLTIVKYHKLMLLKYSCKTFSFGQTKWRHRLTQPDKNTNFFLFVCDKGLHDTRKWVLCNITYTQTDRHNPFLRRRFSKNILNIRNKSTKKYTITITS